MLSINRVMLTGRLTRDPETKYLPSGTAVTMLGIAVNRRYQDKNNEWKDETSFFDVETWGKVAERCAEQLQKGRPVYVEGRLKQESWERDGQKQSKVRIVAERVSGFDVPSRAGGEASDFTGEEAGGGAPPQQQRRAAPRQTGAASDNLDFSEPGVQDDVPF
jgi:single-strand DNA-binding protein